jgi:deoxyribonuclease-4
MPENHRFGLHIDPPLALIPSILSENGCAVYQTTLRNVQRLAKDGIPDEEDQEAFVARADGLWGIAHASMLTSLGSPDPRIRNGSVSALTGDANLAAKLGLAGVCFHVGYEKGHASRQAANDEVVRKLTEVVNKLKPGAKVLLENGAEGTELGQTIEEVGYVSQKLDAPVEKVGFVLDTCHIHVCGFDMAAPDAPDVLAAQIHEHGLADRLVCLHLNDAQYACGSKRDRHAIPGQGTIGEGLKRLLAHPYFATIPCVLEMSVESAVKGIAWLQGEE